MPTARNMNRRLDSSQRFAAREFRHLLGYLDARDYVTVDCLVQSRSPAPCTVSFRYDIHLRDVHCAYGFLEVHRERASAGTFFLLHGYSALERAHEREFTELAEQVRAANDSGAGVQLGFHDSPVDRYLLWRFAQGDEKTLMSWLSGGGGLEFFRGLAASSQAKADFDAAVLETFVSSVQAARASIGDFQLSAGHGGKLGQLLRPRLAELGELGVLVREYFAENWMTPTVLAAAGLSGDVERFKREVPAIAGLTEAGGRLIAMCERLGQYTNIERPMMALLHPATWGKALRDGEWSRLLALPPQPKPRIIVSATPTTLAKELAQTASGNSFELAVFTESTRANSQVPQALAERVASATSFMDLVAGVLALPRDREVVWGPSSRRYCPLVDAMLPVALGEEAASDIGGELQTTAAGLAKWLESEARASVKGRVSGAELGYFLFSSSRRAAGLSRALQHFLADARQPSRIVDHGAGIAFVPLVVHGTLPLAQVICSEVKPQFIEAGRSLWKSLGLELLLEYQHLSMEDFIYPDVVDVIFCGHMLYRLPPDQRARVLRRAVDALRTGGILVINELMNRPELDNTYAYPCLKSDELLDYLGSSVEVHAVDVAPAKLSVIPAKGCVSTFFSRSDNFVVAVKKQASR